MEDWQGSKKPQKRKKRPVRGPEVSAHGQMPAEQSDDRWQKKHRNKKKGSSSGSRDREGWNWVPERAVNWLKVAWLAKFWLATLAAVGLVALLVWFVLRADKKTHIVIVKPAASSKFWLGNTPFLASLDENSFSKNEDLKITTWDLAKTPDDNEWSSTISKVKFGGPDKDVMVFYVNGTGIASAKKESGNEREEDARHIPYLFGMGTKPFDYQVGPVPDVFKLKTLLDRIAELGDESNNSASDLKKLVIIDAHPFESPTNPGLVFDWFPEAVKGLMEEDEGQKYGDLILIVSHGSGEKNWPMPERRSSVFGYCVQLALQGAADGALDGEHNSIVTFDEFCRFVTNRVNDYVKLKHDSTQRPLILAKTGNTDFPITVCPKIRTLKSGLNERTAQVPNSAIVDKYQLTQKWLDLHQWQDRMIEDPVLAARAALVLARMEQLCITYTVDCDELGELQKEWSDIDEEVQRVSAPDNLQAVSLQEQAWMDGRSNFALLPDRQQRDKLNNLFRLWRQLKTMPKEPAETEEPAQEDTNPDDESPPADAASAPEKDDAKKMEEEYRKLLQTYQPDSGHWHIAWKLWNACVESADQQDFAFTKDELEEWLGRIDNRLVRNLMEIKLLQLLVDNVDWGDTDNLSAMNKCLQLCVACRNLSEELLVGECDDVRSLPWIFDDLEQLDNQIRIAEDNFFAGQYDLAEFLFEDARQRLASTEKHSLRWRADVIRSAFDTRNKVFHDAPYYAVLVARHMHREEQRDETVLREMPALSSGHSFSNANTIWLRMVEDNHQLSRLLATKATRSDVEEILRLSEQAAQKRSELQTRLLAFEDYLLKESAADTTLVVCAPDLLICPLPLVQRKELRNAYFTALGKFREDIPIGMKIDATENGARSKQDIKKLEEFLAAAATASLSGSFRAPQNVVCVKPFRRNWEWSRVEQADLEAVLAPFLADSRNTHSSQEDGLTESPVHDELVTFDHWIRSVATTLAENEGRLHDTSFRNRNENDPYSVFRGISTDLFATRRAQYVETRIRKTTRDFWGNNHHGDKLYYNVIAEQLIKRFQRLNFELAVNMRFGNETLPARSYERLAEYRIGLEPDNFWIKCPDFSYAESMDVLPPHWLNVQVGTAWTEISRMTIDSNGRKLRPTMVVQLQQTAEMLDRPITVNTASQAVRRFPHSLGMQGMQGMDSERKEFVFRPETIRENHPHLNTMMAFRGHLRSTSLDIIKIRQDSVPDVVTIKLPAHQPDRFQVPGITVTGGEQIVTDVVFVLDCSGSMKQPFVFGRSDGQLEPDVSSMVASGATRSTGETTRFENSKFYRMRRILINLLRPVEGNSSVDLPRKGLDPKVYRVAVVAIGSQVTFGTTNDPFDIVSPDNKRLPRNSLRPYEDVRLVFPLTPLADEQAIGEMIEDLEQLKPWGYTPLYHGMLTAADELLKSPRFKPRNAKLIVALTDGVEFTREYSQILELGTGAVSSDNYDKLKKVDQETDIQFEFVGFDLPRPDKDYETEFNNRQNEIKSLCGEGHFTKAEQYQEVEDQLQKITRVPRFTVAATNSTGSVGEPESESGPVKIDFEKTWRPKAGSFRRGNFTVEVPNSEIPAAETARQTVFLYGVENLTFDYNGRSLQLKNRVDHPGGSPETALIDGESLYNVSLLPINQQSQPLALQFAFQNQDPGKLSVRPDRVCLQLIPSSGAGKAYTLQDVNYDRNTDLGIPCATFLAPPALKEGNYTFRLWYQPFDGNMVDAPGGALDRSFLENFSKQQRNTWNISETGIADGKVRARIYGFRDVQTVTVELSVDDPSNAHLLRDMLVDVQTLSSGETWTTDFYTERTYSTEVLELESGADPPAVESISVSCTFELNQKYEDKDIFVSVRSIEDEFRATANVEFIRRIGN